MKPYKANTRNDLPRIAEVLGLNGEEVKDMQAVSAVLPFKVNNYVLENLIDRNNLPNDPDVPVDCASARDAGRYGFPAHARSGEPKSARSRNQVGGS